MSRRPRPVWLAGTSTIVVGCSIAGIAVAQQSAASTRREKSRRGRSHRLSRQPRGAINVKREEAGVVDVIKAEDIAAFPDQNLAESLQRIPGVAITRVGGEGRQISVRGLGPEYTRVRINGMEALATSGGTSSGGAVGNNRGRGFDFNVFASEMFNSLTVRKTGSADVEEGSLGATVDLQHGAGRSIIRSRRSSFPASSVTATCRKRPTRASPRSRLNSGWMARSALMLSVAYGERNTSKKCTARRAGDRAVRTAVSRRGSTLPGYTLAQIRNSDPATAIFHPRNPSYNSYDQNQERLGVTGGLQFQLTDATAAEHQRTLRQARRRASRAPAAAPFHSPAAAAAAKAARSSATASSTRDNNLIYGVFDNVDLRSRASHHELTTTFQQYTADLTHDFTDRFSMNALVGYAESIFDSPRNVTVTFEHLGRRRLRLRLSQQRSRCRG